MKITIQEDTRYQVDELGIVYGPSGRPLVAQTNGKYGYRKVSLGRNRQRYVHRLVAAAFLGEPDGRDVDHINSDVSDNRLVNLRYVTHAENMRVRQDRVTHCQRGHSFADGVAWYRGRRICLECRRLRDRQRYARRRSSLTAVS